MRETDEAVVEIQISDHDAVGENGQIGARPDTIEQDCRTLLCGNVPCQLDRNVARSRRVTAECAAERIEDRALGYPYDIFREVLILEARCIAGKPFVQGNLTGASSRRMPLDRLLRYSRKCRCACRQAG